MDVGTLLLRLGIGVFIVISIGCFTVWGGVIADLLKRDLNSRKRRKG